jgi:cytochrome c-type biogenesis protein
LDTEALGFALAAGLVAAVNPCGFALLPAYLGLVVGSSVSRALAATAIMSGGFVTVFAVVGVVLSEVAASVARYLPWITIVVGLALLALGGWLVSGRELPTLARPGLGGAPTQRLGSMFGYGVAYALASLSCTIAPFLAVTASTFRGGALLDGLAVYAAYALGMTLVVGALATAAALASTSLSTRLRRTAPYVSRAGGALLLLVGIYVTYYGVYEVRLFEYGGSADDPVIDVAFAVQGRIVDWVDGVGAVWWGAIVTIVVSVGMARAVIASRAR